MKMPLEDEIKDNDLFYKTLVDKSSDSMICLDRTGKFIYANHAYADILNRQRADIIGKNLCDFYTYDEWRKRLDVINEVFETGETKVIELKNYKRGFIIHLLTSLKPINDSRGKIKMVLCISKDITELKKVAEELKERELLLRESQRVAHIGSYAVDIKSRTLKCSEELNLIFGIDETYPHTLEGWLELIHPDWREKLIKYKSEVDAEKLRFDCEYKIIRFNDQEERWVHGLGELKINENGEPLQMLGTTQDITEHKAAEEEIIYLSYHDQLTGLYNRRFYEEELKRLDTQRNLPITIAIGDVNGLKLINDSFGHATGDELLKKVATVIKKSCRVDDITARLGGDEFIILLPKTDTAEAGQIIKRINKLTLNEKVESIDISISFGYETKHNENEEIQEILKKAEDYMYKKKLFESQSIRGNIISTIISTLYQKNKREELHSNRVASLCEKMGIALELPEHEIKELKTVGLFHDIGKIAIDENILNNTRKLTNDEWKQIKRHPEIGYRILSTVNDMSEMAEYVLAHHERWDGKGYPKGLKEEEIPFVSRIIAIADCYDAITSERSYQSILSGEVAVEVLQKNAGVKFDPKLVNIFIEKVLGKPVQ